MKRNVFLCAIMIFMAGFGSISVGCGEKELKLISEKVEIELGRITSSFTVMMEHFIEPQFMI